MFYNSPRPYYRFIGVSSTGRFDLYDISTTDRPMVKGYLRMTDETKDTTKEQPNAVIERKERANEKLRQELKDLKAALQTEIDLRKEVKAERDRAVEKHERATATIRETMEQLDSAALTIAEQATELEAAAKTIEQLQAKLADAPKEKAGPMADDPPHFVESRHLIGEVTKPDQTTALDREIELLKNNGWYAAHETVNTIVISDNAPKMPTTTIKSLKIMRWERVVSIEAKQQPDDSASDEDKTIDMPQEKASEEGTDADAAAELQEKAS